MSKYCSYCHIFEGGLPETKKQKNCDHRYLWLDTKVRSNFTFDESIFLWLKDKSRKTQKPMSYWLNLALIDMKIKDDCSK
jgi:hypothetical protein